MSLETKPFDMANHLKTETEVVDFLSAAFEEEDPAYIAHALGVVARAHGISQLSKETGLTRETLYKSLSDEGNPTLSTLTKVMKAMGLRVTVQTA
ncbi:addiction module antidote protein [Acidocella sp.]|uniref:addiction module antidote protein n=1 Tax=Acidocella sp. TaxID=50710 RepID=UPI002637ECCE|nr:addiction module antidote protein [Acidocella sp.]